MYRDTADSAIEMDSRKPETGKIVGKEYWITPFPTDLGQAVDYL